jgi:outer membrane protein insertion porin family
MVFLRRFALLLSCFLLFAAHSNAQTTATDALDDIVVVSTGAAIDDSLIGLVKVTISVSPGDLVSSVKLEDVQNQVLETGFFRTAKAEIVKDGTRNILRITVEPNPTIDRVEIKGNNVVQSEPLINFLAQSFNVAAGVMVSNLRIEEARAAIGQAYKQEVGFPFVPEVKVEQSAPANGKVVVTYTINESAAIKEIKISGATLVPNEELLGAFKALNDAKKFDARAYLEGIRAAGALYTKKGYRGSGPNARRSELVDGVLNIAITELKIAGVDSSAIGVAPEQLTLKTGDFFNYDALIAQTRNLAKGRDKQVGIRLEQAGEDTVIVTFTIEDAPAGPIRTIKIEGNTAIPTAQLQRLVTQKIGDTYNAQIAREIDYVAIQEAYQTAGFAVVPQPQVSYADGTYTIVLREQKVVKYEIAWRGPRKTDERVVLRELPATGALYDVNKLRNAIRRILPIVSVRDVRFTTPDETKPEELAIIFELEETSTGQFLPGISYSTLDGVSGSIQYTESNAWGLAHNITLGVQGGPNDAGQTLSGAFSYTIPWLDFDFLDFREKRTEFSIYFSSNVNAKRVVRGTEGFLDIPKSATNNNDTYEGPRYFSIRNTGGGISLGREVLTNFTMRFSFDLQYEQNFLEGREATNPPPAQSRYIEANKDTAPVVVSGIPGDNFTAFTGISGTYSTKNRDDFPTSGVVVEGSTGYGFGTNNVNSATPTGLSWTSTTLGFRTYLGLGWDEKGEFGVGGENRNFALAFRFNTGAIFGDAPANRLFNVGGAGGAEAFTIRGYDFSDMRGEIFYTGSLELRYDFGLQTAVTYGLLGIAWVDFGNAWGGGPGVETRVTRTTGTGAAATTSTLGSGIQFGYGLGLQINLGFGGVRLPAIRLDYGFSQWNPSGRFYFRLGFPF